MSDNSPVNNPPTIDTPVPYVPGPYDKITYKYINPIITLIILIIDIFKSFK
jgi:hypothetical protein